MAHHSNKIPLNCGLMAPKKNQRRGGKGRGKGVSKDLQTKKPNKEQQEFDFGDARGGQEAEHFNKGPKKSPMSTSSDNASAPARRQSMPAYMPPEEAPSVSPFERAPRKKKKFTRANFGRAISKMRKLLMDSKDLRIKVRSIKILSSVANDMLERFAEEAAKLTRSKGKETIQVRSAEASVKLNVPKGLYELVMTLSRRATVKYSGHAATIQEKDALLDQMRQSDKKDAKTDGLGEGKGPKKLESSMFAEKDKECKKDKESKKAQSLKSEYLSKLTTEQFCQEARVASKNSREAKFRKRKGDEKKSKQQLTDLSMALPSPLQRDRPLPEPKNPSQRML